MNRAITVAVACEGGTDYAFISEIIEGYWKFVDKVDRQFPEYDEMQHRYGRGGCEKLKTWCLEHGKSYIHELGRGTVADTLVVLIDQDAAQNKEILQDAKKYRCSKKRGRRLCDEVKKWLGNNLPKTVVIAIPSPEIEAWILAAFPELHPKKNIECYRKAKNDVRTNILRQTKGQDPTDAYGDTGRGLVEDFDRICEVCTEARNFRDKLNTAFRVVRRG